MATNKEKAEKLIADANRKLFPGSGLITKIFSAFGSDKSSHIEDAIELYGRAANIYKMEREWSEAGKIFVKIAELASDNGNTFEASTKFVDAANCYKKCNQVEAVNCLVKSINILTDMGRFSVAAKQHNMVAEIYEGDNGDVSKAIEHYSKAADYFQCDESNSAANKCLLNVARYSAQLEQYDRAIQIYESIGQSTLDNNLLKYGAKEHFLRAGLCHLCVDLLNAQIAVKKYIEMSPAFSDSRECKLLNDLIARIEAQDSDGFSEVVQDYDSISRLDSWFTTVLLRIKNRIEPEVDMK